MSDHPTDAQAVDPERPRDAAPFDQPTGYSGQGYTLEREVAEGRRHADPEFQPAPDGRDLPLDNGARATIDPKSGEVHGAGMGTGGGQEGEDLDTGAEGGAGYPLTGGEGADKTPGDLGPKTES